ncbi:hypothetical protein [Amedibacillus sp. YH-ame10]
MISKYTYLLRMQLYNLFGMNRLFHSHDAKEKQRTAIVGGLGLVAISILITYIAKFSNSMAEAGLTEALPTIMVVICSVATLVLTFIKSTGVLIGLKDYDMVMSLPVNSLAIVMSRITMLYLINLIIGFIAMLPSSIVYIIYAQPAFSNYLYLIGALLFTPIIPMMISLSLGVFIVAVSSHSKHKNIFSLVLSTVGVLGIVYASTKTQSMNASQIANLGEAMTNAINQFYPPATLFSNSLLYNDWISFIIFTSSSLILGIVFVAIVSYFYKTLNTSVFSQHTSRNYKLVELKRSSPFMALYKKEINRLTSCTIYALNSCIGIILLFVVSVMAVFFMPASFKAQIETMGILKVIQNVLPVALAIFVSMTSTTAASLSLEGKNRWIMCSAPTKAQTIYNAKIAVNLTVILPVLLISTILLRIAFPLSLENTLLMFITPTIYAFFISVLGMFLNIKFPKYDWTSEYYAVKGGAISVLATVGAGMASSLIPLYLCIFFSKYSMLIMIGITIAILMATIIIYQAVCKTELYMI